MREETRRRLHVLGVIRRPPFVLPWWRVPVDRAHEALTRTFREFAAAIDDDDGPPTAAA